MKSIDTYYDSNFFRSRLEARWAVFFKTAGIKYKYELEGFKYNGECYLPDFYLPEVRVRGGEEQGVYIEIKPDSFLECNIPQSKWFTNPLILFNGMPHQFLMGGEWDNDSARDGGYELVPNWDNCMRIHKCSCCGRVKIEFDEGNYNTCYTCEKDNKRSYPCDANSLRYAAMEAIKYRFEHKPI